MKSKRIKQNLQAIVKRHPVLQDIESAFLRGKTEISISKLPSGIEKLVYNCLLDIFDGSFILAEDGDSCNYTKVTSQTTRNELIKILQSYGYHSNESLDNRNEYFFRGDVCFLFNSAYRHLIRIDFWGDDIEEINLIDFVTRRKIASIQEIIFSKDKISLFHPESCFSEAIVYKDSKNSVFTFDFTDVPSFHSNLNLFDKFLSSVQKKNTQIFLATSFENRLMKFKNEVDFIDENIYKGWQSDTLEIIVLTDFELFDTIIPQSYEFDEKWLSIQKLNPGDFIVHKNHGIAVYGGIKIMEFEGRDVEYLVLNYAQNDKLYVPINQLDYVSKFIGISKVPKLTRLGTQNWDKLKSRAKKAIKNIARELLDLYATREIRKGFAFSEDTDLQKKLIANFPFTETEDQARAWEEIKFDMESDRPMDRVLVGDVGFGKTELAVRAAFKAVQDEKQVAILAPTTILVEQHYTVLKKRLSDFPINIDVLSRFNEKNIKEVIHKIEIGLVDIVIGTHRLLLKDVKLRDLGLLIVDEEQKFGVEQKEHLKYLKKEVDVLSMTATPIPRSLNMSLSGIKDISILLQPPEGRKPIKTFVHEFNYEKIIEAIKKEIGRGGQIYIVHNKVKTINTFAEELKKKLPTANFIIGHGQMSADRLSRVMRDFNEKKYDVLVCSTIIENGLDMPDVNTIIIDDAHKFGLAQLHQLRGRVGRSEREAYCFLFYPKGKVLSETANARLETVVSNQALGSGFNISTKDLELRGTGNLLGRDQSGNINAIGYSLYIQLLREEIKNLKKLI